MTATRLEPAKKRHGLNLTFFAAGLGNNPRKQEYARQIPQGPKCGSRLASCQNFGHSNCAAKARFREEAN